MVHWILGRYGAIESSNVKAFEIGTSIKQFGGGGDIGVYVVYKSGDQPTFQIDSFEKIEEAQDFIAKCLRGVTGERYTHMHFTERMVN